ncbi:ArgE/DapE family deacylase [Halomonas sp. GXIMD04776]|uniref:ArgE/DapE family deacylase n=1 Tax=Halomonas sp. GXIMD04776 TaxID=3415605 RepID=UPI003CB7777D
MLSQTEQRVLDQCDLLFPQVLDMTRDLVSQYSVLGREQGALEAMAAWFKHFGLPLEHLPLDDPSLHRNPHHAPVDWSNEGRYSLVSRLNPDSSRPHLVFNGHLDVVPAEPVGMWSQAPWQPWEKDGWLYGRGAGDMKAGIAAMVMAVQAVREAGVTIDHPLTLQTVIEEECTGNGALACINRGLCGDFVLIPEPFGARIYAGQVGALWFRLRVAGVPAHVLDTSAGSNAIETLIALIPALKTLEKELNEAREAPYDELTHPFNLGIGTLEGGNWPSSVPAHGVLEGRIGFPPGMSPDTIMERVRRTVKDAHRQLGEAEENLVVEFHGFRSEGHLVDLEHPGIHLLSECHEALHGDRPEAFLATCTTDLRAFHVGAGVAGTCYGPVAERIHGIDECVNIESIRHTLKAYALFLCRWPDQQRQRSN